MTLLIGHEIGADLGMLVRAGYQIPAGPYFCTHTAARWCWPDEPDGGLESLALKTTNIGQWRETLGRIEFEDFDHLPDHLIAQRCGGDAEVRR